jgi:hypothetical protein
MIRDLPGSVRRQFSTIAEGRRTANGVRCA